MNRLMIFLNRKIVKTSTLEIIDNLALHTVYPQTKNGLKGLGYSENDVKKAIASGFVEEYDFPVASFGSGRDISYVALRLTKNGRKIAKSDNKNTEISSKLFWWFMSLVSSVVAGLFLAYFLGSEK